MEEVINNQVEQKSNKNVKPNIILRLAAALIDICSIFLLSLGAYSLFGKTSLGASVTKYNEEIVTIQDSYKLQTLVEGSTETIGYKIYESEEGYANATGLVHTDDVGNYRVVNNSTISDALKNAYSAALKKDVSYQNASFNYRLCDFGVMSLAISIAEIILIFAIPMTNKRRATIGKLLAGTQLITYKIEGPAKWYQLIGRFFFVLIIETLLPYLFVSTLALIIAPVIALVISLINKKGRTLRDLITGTMIIDKRSYAPLIEPKESE